MKKIFGSFAAAMWVLSLAVSFAQTATAKPSASVNNYLPAVDPTAYYSIYGSQTMQQWRYHLGGSFNYAKSPFQAEVNSAQVDVISHLLVGDFHGAVGVTDWAQVGMHIPVAFLNEIRGSVANDDLALGPQHNGPSLGDILLESKFMLVDIETQSIGVAVLPYLTFPTGSGNDLVGNDGFTGGIRAIVDYNFRRKFEVSLNLGTTARKDVTLITSHVDNHLLTFGVGAMMKTIDWLDLVAEIYGKTNFSEFFSDASSTPVELDGGVRFNLGKSDGLKITTGGGVGLTTGYGTPTYRAIVALSYSLPVEAFPTQKSYLPEPESILLPESLPTDQPSQR